MKSHALAAFWKCYKELPEDARKLADKNFALLKSNPRHPSLGLQRKGEVYDGWCGIAINRSVD